MRSASRNPLTGLSGLQRDDLPSLARSAIAGRNPLTGLSGLQLATGLFPPVGEVLVAIPLRG